MFECADRAWPDTAAVFRAKQILLVSNADGIGYLWNDRRHHGGDSPRTTVLQRDELGPEWFDHALALGEIHGVPTMGFSLEDGLAIDDELDARGVTRWHDVTLQLAFHESFHNFTDQNDWPVTQIPLPTPYPEDPTPRYLRAALVQSMMNAPTSGAEAARAAAAYWQGRFSTEYVDEMNAVRAVDLIEGTAQYVEGIKSGIAAYGCDAPDAKFDEGIAEHAPLFLATPSFDPAREPYGLGVAAGLLLHGNPAWPSRAEAGETPVEILVDGVAAVAQPDDPQLMASASQVVGARNAERATSLAPLIDALPRVDVIASRFQSSAWSRSIGQSSFGSPSSQLGR